MQESYISSIQKSLDSIRTDIEVVKANTNQIKAATENLEDHVFKGADSLQVQITKIRSDTDLNSKEISKLQDELKELKDELFEVKRTQDNQNAKTDIMWGRNEKIIMYILMALLAAGMAALGIKGI